MESQVVLCVSLDKLTNLYFSRWEYGRRVPGADSPFDALYNRKDPPYLNERLSAEDFVLVIEPLIKWSEE